MGQPTEEVRTWQGRLALAGWYHEKIGNTEDRWDKFTHALASDFTFGDRGDTDPEAIDVNMVHSTTQLNLAPLHTNDFFVTVRPKRARSTVGGRTVDNIEHARNTEIETNYWLRELRFREKVLRRCVHDAETTNHGYSYVGYLTGEHEHLVNTTDSGGERVGRVEWNPLVKVDQPFIRRLPPKQIRIPPGQVDLDEHPWVAVGWRKPKRVVQAQFPGTNMDDLEPSISPFDADAMKAVGKLTDEVEAYLESEDAKLVQLWQIWDQESGKLITLADGFPRVIEKLDWPYEVEGFPICDLYFVDVPDEYYGTPPIQMYWPQQRELNWARTAAKKRNNRTKAVIAVKKGDIAESVIEQYERANDGTIISVPLEDEQRMSDVLEVIPPLPAPNEAYADGQVQIGDIMFTTGHGQQSRAAGDPNIVSATESANVDKWSLVRSTDRGSRTKGFILDNVRKLWQILKQFPDVKRDRMIVGELGARMLSRSYSLREIEGEFDFNMDVGSLVGDNPVRRQQISLANYNLFAANPRVDHDRLILDVLDAQGKPDPVGYLADRDPEVEFRKMQQGLPVEAMIRDDHLAHDQAHRAQKAALEREIDSIPDELIDEAQGFRMRLVLALLESHRNHHAFFVQQLTGQGPGAEVDPGQPQAENLLRQNVAGAGETEAELVGGRSGGDAVRGLGGIAGQVQ